MAKLTVTAVLFCLFAAAIALTPSENDKASASASDSASAATKVALPSADEVNPLISLPTDVVKDENSAVTTVALPSSDAVKEENAAAKPLIEDTFRPINRHFLVRRSKHACSHHFVDPKVRKNVEIPYGNDMVVPSGENSDFNGASETIHVEGRQRVKLRHHHHHHKDDDADSDSDSDSDDDEEAEDRISKKIFHKHHHRSDRKELKELKKMRKNFRIQKEKEEKLGFMNRVRRFLDNYF